VSVTELLDAARALPRDEQLKLAEALLADPAGRGPTTAEEALLNEMFPPGLVYEVYTPFDAAEAAVAIQAVLDEGAVRK
jgi:hypothetical protein